MKVKFVKSVPSLEYNFVVKIKQIKKKEMIV